MGVLCESLGPHGTKFIFFFKIYKKYFHFFLNLNFFLKKRYYPQILQKLHPLFFPSNQNNGEISSTVDNACGAVARMIIASPSSLPLDQV